MMNSAEIEGLYELRLALDDTQRSARAVAELREGLAGLGCLDSFLKVHGLTMASFDSKSLDEALRMTGLDDRALSGLGDAHRDRALIVRGALLDRLPRR